MSKKRKISEEEKEDSIYFPNVSIEPIHIVHTRNEQYKFMKDIFSLQRGSNDKTPIIFESCPAVIIQNYFYGEGYTKKDENGINVDSTTNNKHTIQLTLEDDVLPSTFVDLNPKIEEERKYFTNYIKDSTNAILKKIFDLNWDKKDYMCSTIHVRLMDFKDQLDEEYRQDKVKKTPNQIRKEVERKFKQTASKPFNKKQNERELNYNGNNMGTKREAYFTAKKPSKYPTTVVNARGDKYTKEVLGGDICTIIVSWGYYDTKNQYGVYLHLKQVKMLHKGTGFGNGFKKFKTHQFNTVGEDEDVNVDNE